jgi:hypothetical protein
MLNVVEEWDILLHPKKMMMKLVAAEIEVVEVVDIHMDYLNYLDWGIFVDSSFNNNNWINNMNSKNN